MRILLVEPYFGGSHRAWAEGYAARSAHDVHLLTLPARWWKWRMRGAALTLAELARAWVDRHGPPDLVLVTDMLDLPAFLGFGRRFLGDPAVVIYMHESQLTYPVSPRGEPDLGYAFTNWLSAAAADLVLFNSEFHRSVFYAELPRLLRHFPDYTHEGAVAAVRERSEVLPVGVDVTGLPPRPEAGGPPAVLWNQRWEHDKDPVAFIGAIDRVIGAGTELALIVCGRSFRQVAQEFEAARPRWGERLLHMGYVPDRDRYRELLARSDIVVSTALHEFFGVAVVEAIAAGAFPILPDRLSYPELLDPAYHSRCLYQSDGRLPAAIRWAVDHPRQRREMATELSAQMGRFDWGSVAPSYDRRLEQLVGGSG